MPQLTIPLLCAGAERFSAAESRHAEKALYGVTDGKAVGTYLEHKFRKYLQDAGYTFQAGNSGVGVDFPDLGVDMKVTSIRQPQSSCPFKNARQKIYGLGYSLIVFVYEKVDDRKRRTGTLRILHTIFVEKERTGDHYTTKNLRRIVDNEGNVADLIAYMSDSYLASDENELNGLAEAVMAKRPEQGRVSFDGRLNWLPTEVGEYAA